MWNAPFVTLFGSRVELPPLDGRVDEGAHDGDDSQVMYDEPPTVPRLNDALIRSSIT